MPWSLPQLAPFAPVESSDRDSLLGRVVGLARRHLGVDLVWISEFTDTEQVIVELDGDVEGFGVHRGWRGALDQSYCQLVASGMLDAVVVDTTANQVTAAMPVTKALDIGAYVGAPIVAADGRVRGTLCAMSHEPTPSLGVRDVAFLELFSEMLASELDRRAGLRVGDEVERARVAEVLAGQGFRILYQPIVRLRTMRVGGVEALVRFESGPPSPADWLAEADRVGARAEVELALVRAALADLDQLPDGCYMSVNVSPTTAVDPRLVTLLAASTADRVVVEVTEQAGVDDYDELDRAMAEIRGLGARIAVDDAGAGFAGLTHLVRIRPDIVKLDIALTKGIDADPVRAAMARSLVDFASSIGATLIAEGIETLDELATVTRIGFDGGQGYVLARPGPLPPPAIVVHPDRRLFDGPLGRIGDRLVRHAASSADMDEFVTPLLERMLELTELETSYVTYLDHDALTLEHRYVNNTTDLVLPPAMSVDWADSLCIRCRQKGITWTADASLDLDHHPMAEAFGIRSFVSLPITDPGGVTIGTLCAIGREPRYIDDASLTELDAISRAIAAYRGQTAEA